MESTTTTVFPNTVVLELLNKYNYDDWVEMVQTYLISQDLWDAVDPGIPLDTVHELNADHDRVAETSMDVKGKTSEASDDDKLKRDKKNAAALHAIKISCGQDALFAIRGIVSARKAWKALARKFRPHLILDLPDFQGEKGRSIEYYMNFFQAIEQRDWKTAQKLYKINPDLLKATYKSANYTALHHAVTSTENEEIVKDMVERMSEEDLEIKESSCGWTALAQAIESGTTRMVECMIQKNGNLLGIADNVGVIPVVLALYKRMDLVPTLYSATPKGVLLREGGKHGATVISKCIKLGKPVTTSIALKLITYAPSLAIARDNTGKSPVYTLACAPVLFRELRFWEQWIYDSDNESSFGTGPPVKSGITSTYSDLEMGDFEFGDLFMKESGSVGPPVESDTSNINSALTRVRRLVSKLVQLSGVYKSIEEKKSLHERSIKLLENMCETIAIIKDENTLKDGLVFEALSVAVDERNVMFIEELMKANPVFAASSTDQQYSREIYVHAIQSRQVEPIEHILINVPKSRYVLEIGAMADKYGNNLLHEAARLPPSLSIREAALQMQKEIRWFEEVKKLLHPTASTDKNVDNLTPGEVFTQSHKDLVIEGEKWMKEMATSCSVVAALIVTMVFTAAFTVPGADDHKKDKKLYNTFMISDGISLFTSTTSVFVFLGILTSRFQEHDFRISLPRKLFIGLTILFLSIASMLITFCVVLLIMLPESWVPIPVILLGALPVTLFSFMQSPLLFRILKSTYFGRSFSLTSKPESTFPQKIKAEITDKKKNT